MASTPSSPVLTSEGSPTIILDEEDGGWWMLVQGSSCTMPAERTVITYPFEITGFYLPVV